MTITESENVRKALRERLSKAYHRGNAALDVRAGDLCREVGGDLKTNQDLSICCAIMRAAMNSNDRVIKTPVNGYGEDLTVRYMLPHQSS